MSCKRYLAYDEGCQECGEPSGVVGFYDKLEDAEAAVERAVARQVAAWAGQHVIHVIDLQNPRKSEFADEV